MNMPLTVTNVLDIFKSGYFYVDKQTLRVHAVTVTALFVNARDDQVVLCNCMIDDNDVDNLNSIDFASLYSGKDEALAELKTHADSRHGDETEKLKDKS